MRIDAIELRHIAMELVAPFETSFGRQDHKEALLVRVLGAEGQAGWGECVSMADPFYSPEYLAGSADVIRRWLAPMLMSAPDVSAMTVGPLLDHVVGHAMAKAALEMAVLDAELRGTGESLAHRLGATRDRVPSGVSVGIQASVPELVDVVGGYLAQGYVRIKIKIRPGWDVEPVRALREAFGDIPLQVDANSAYTLGDAGVLRALDDFDLLLIEQPLHEDDLRLHAQLATQLRTPVCLDESIVSARAAADAIALGATRVINIKAGRVGGYVEARRIHDIARANGVAVWCGGMLETGLGRAANAALAALPGFTLPGDVSASARFYARDITEPVELVDGHVMVPTGPGLGVEPVPEILDEVTRDVEVLRP